MNSAEKTSYASWRWCWRVRTCWVEGGAYRKSVGLRSSSQVIQKVTPQSVCLLDFPIWLHRHIWVSSSAALPWPPPVTKHLEIWSSLHFNMCLLDLYHHGLVLTRFLLAEAQVLGPARHSSISSRFPLSHPPHGNLCHSLLSHSCWIHILILEWNSKCLAWSNIAAFVGFIPNCRILAILISASWKFCQ